MISFVRRRYINQKPLRCRTDFIPFLPSPQLASFSRLLLCLSSATERDATYRRSTGNLVQAVSKSGQSARLDRNVDVKIDNEQNHWFSSRTTASRRKRVGGSRRTCRPEDLSLRAGPGRARTTAAVGAAVVSSVTADGLTATTTSSLWQTAHSTLSDNAYWTNDQILAFFKIRWHTSHPYSELKTVLFRSSLDND